MREFLAGQYPSAFPERGITITGENFPPPPFANMLVQLVGVVQLFAMATIFFGESVWRIIPFLSRPPEFYYQMKENPIMVAMILFLIVPSFVNSMVQSGAFEIELDGTLVYSKLQTGRMPTGQELIEVFNAAGLTQGV